MADTGVKVEADPVVTTEPETGVKTEVDAAAKTDSEVGGNGGSVDTTGDDMSPWRCLVLNPKIVLITLLTNVGACYIGYENLVLSVCLAMPAFQETFAIEVNGVFTIPAYWQAAWNAMYNVMSMFGSFVAGWVQDKFGRRALFYAGIAVATGGVAVSYTASTPAWFLGGKIMAGFAVGMISTATQTYVSETAPLSMRGIALSANTIMMNLGFLIAISTTYSRIDIMDTSAFRVLFAAGWAFPGVLALGVPFIPESPYWLVMKDRHQDARRALERLSRPGENIDALLRRIEAIIEAERQLVAEKISFLECFRGQNRRRTGIILLCMYIPQVVGASLSANAPYFLSQTGLSSDTVIMLVQIGISMGVASALINVYLMMKLRPRTLMFFGVGLCCSMYLIMGICSVLHQTQKTLLAIGVALEFTSISYGPAVGSSWAVAGAVSASRLRAKSLGIGNTVFNLYGTIWTIILPYLFNTDEANLGGKIAWIFLGQGLIMLALLFFYVPDTKDRSYEELDSMFEQRIPARKFHLQKTITN
ncbi:general substrate transporter [Xylariales sp. PMI_506]|nr:general substrate transporter [Xylariales sp. PMI_506]